MIDIDYPLIWTQGVVDKVWHKHKVTPEEVDEAVIDDEAICHKASGGSYCVYGQSISGRYLFVVLGVTSKRNQFKVITARKMQGKEKRYYRKKK